MMPFAIKLFTIQLHNSYYKAGIGNDLDLVADTRTQQLMAGHKMKLRQAAAGKFEVVWLTSGLEDPLKVLQDKMGQIKYRFLLQIKNPPIINCSALSIGESPDLVYHFHNQHTPPKLHQADYVNDADFVPEAAIGNAHEIGPKVLGVVDIHLKQLWEDGKTSIADWPINYSIHIQARATIWRYHIVDNSNRIKMPLAIAIDQDNAYFIKKEDAQKDHVYVFESKEPLPLADKPAKVFSLIAYANQKVKSAGEVLIANLPLPQLVGLSRKIVDGKQIFYSDIVVYV